CAVRSLKPMPRSLYCVKHSQGESVARTIVLATNGYTPAHLNPLALFVRPVGSYIAVTSVLPMSLRRCFVNRRAYVTSSRMMNYFRLMDDGRLLFGGRNNLLAGEAPETTRRGLEKRMATLFPELKGIAFDHIWGGRLATTIDRFPYAGGRDGVYYSGGYSGHGVPISLWSGRALADQILHGEAHPLSDIRHRKAPGRAVWPLLLRGL